MRTRQRAGERLARAASLAMLVVGCGGDRADVPASGARTDRAGAPLARVDPARQKLDPALDPPYRAILAGRHAEARAELERYLAQDPARTRPGQAEFLIGLSFHEPELYAQAEPHFARAVELEPDYLATFYYHGFCLFHLGRIAEARRAFERYLAVEPGKADAAFGLALVALEEDRLDEADALLARAIAATEPRLAAGAAADDARSDLSRYLARRADVALRRDDLAGARRDLERSVELWPDHYEAWSKLHRVLTRLGDPAAAARALATSERIQARRFPQRKVSGR